MGRVEGNKIPQEIACRLKHTHTQKTPLCKEALKGTSSYCCLVTESCPALCDPRDCSPPGSSVHGILQARILGVGCHALLQGIFRTQGSNPCLLHWQVDLLPLSYQGEFPHPIREMLKRWGKGPPPPTLEHLSITWRAG